MMILRLREMPIETLIFFLFLQDKIGLQIDE